MTGFIDSHNHSLPSIDDGAKSLAMALDMLRIAEQYGTCEVILTPHHLNGAFSNHTASIKQSYDELSNMAQSAGIKLKLHLGSEVHLVPEATAQLINGTALTYCDLKKAALIEPPKRGMPPGYQSIIAELLSSGITPIIAHPERNQFLRNNLAEVEHLVNIGCKIQLTAQSLTGEFGDSIAQASLQLIQRCLVHLVASDAHRVEGRSPDLTKAYSWISDNFCPATANLLLKENPKRITLGKELKTIELKDDPAYQVFKSTEAGSAPRKWWSKLFT